MLESYSEEVGLGSILELRVVVSKLGRRGEMIKPSTCLQDSDGGGEKGGDGKEAQEVECPLLL